METGDMIGLILGFVGAGIGIGAVLFVLFSLVRGFAKKSKRK
jgi:hypothetical protein|tara:strand:- start:106 stop:231 length:126 start_codon:yes stop_codon:yes gene_type:complete